MKKIVLLMLCLLLSPITTFANVDDDCFKVMDGDNKKREPIGGYNYTSRDEMGIKEACKTGFPSAGERFMLRRIGTDAFDAKYEVRRSYCWFMNGFDKWSCQWGNSDKWGDNYSATFDINEIKPADATAGKKILKSGNGMLGTHVCLKRYASKEEMKHGGVNNTNRSLICGYIVYALVGDACGSPWGGWQGALFGCINEPPKSGPPTYNTSIPASLTPYVDPNIELYDTKRPNGDLVEGYISKGSTFDQPLIQLLNGYGNKPMVLRFKYPGDKRVIDNRPVCESFPNSKGLTYCAKISDSDPSKVCACERSTCASNLFIGCAMRPAPYQSNLALVAEYADNTDSKTKEESPAVSPAFAFTDGDGNIIYYDETNTKVYFDKDGNAFKVGSDGTPTTNPAKGKLHYNKLPLPSPPLAIRENSEQKTGDGKFIYYNKDSGKVYGVEFTAIIPQFKEDNKTIFFRALETPYTRASTDGCGALALAVDPNDPNKPRLYVPAGNRDRTYCACPENADPRSCAVPPETKCYDGKVVNHDPEAAKIYCPGKFTDSSANAGGGKICLQVASAWGRGIGDNFTNDKDMLCADIPNRCRAVTDPTQTSGFSMWPKQEIGEERVGRCDSAGGFEDKLEYYLEPANPIAKDKFNCAKIKSSADCDQKYNSIYLPSYKALMNAVQEMQLISYSENRNLSADDLKKLDVKAQQAAGMHKIMKKAVPVKRKCLLHSNQGRVENGCMIMDGCKAISLPTQNNGYAKWPEVRPLNEAEVKKAAQPDVTFSITMEGTCEDPYKKISSKITRQCVVKRQGNGELIKRWQDVSNPCVKQK